MNILYLGNDRPHCTERLVKYALKQQGHRVVLRSIRGMTYQDVLHNMQTHDPEVVLFSKPEQPWVTGFLEECRTRKVKTVCWLWDLYWGYRPTKPRQFMADYLFTTDGGHRDLWRKWYPHHQLLRQGIHKPDHCMVEDDYQYDVMFVGNPTVHSARTRLVKHLRMTYGSRFLLVQNVRGMALNKLLATARIVVGDSYPSPHYWSNRIYEMLGRGAFLLYPHTAGLDQEFVDGRHYVSFLRDDFNGLDRLIARYLEDWPLREQIKRQGFEHCGSHYTYEHRTAQLTKALLAPAYGQ